jgi:hypothetical protein
LADETFGRGGDENVIAQKSEKIAIDQIELYFPDWTTQRGSQ